MRQKALERYPLEYWTLIRDAHQNGKTDVECKDPSAARALRENLYLFRRALRAASEESPDSDRLLLARARADRLTFSIRASKVIIHV
jgi:hypothetical protein